MRKRTYASVLIAVLLTALSLGAAAAHAAPPFSSAEEIVRLTFEPSGETFSSIVPTLIRLEPDPVAYWGPNSAVKRSGEWSLWCAGTAYPSQVLRTYGNYPSVTRGEAVRYLPELADYYSSKLSFYYLMPSRGGADEFAFAIGWGEADSQGAFVGRTASYPTFALTPAGAWVKSKTFDLASPDSLHAETNLSRRPGSISFRYFDYIETYQTPASGLGVAVDDVSVSGYKYGPVRNVTRSYEPSAGVRLEWEAPAASNATSAADARPLTYRLWRSLAAKDDWTELTAGARATGTSFLDTTAVVGSAYDYVVQAWDTGDGTGHGPQGTPETFIPGAVYPLASTLSFSVPSTSDYASAKVSGKLSASGFGVAGREVEIQKLVGDAWDTVATAATSASGAFSADLAPTAKTSYRAVFSGDDIYQGQVSSVRSVLPRARLTRTTSWSTLYLNKTYYAKGYIEPYHKTSNSNKVKIRAYKKGRDGDYHYVKSFTASYVYYKSTKTAYKAPIKFTSSSSRGTWKFVAYHATDSTNYKTYGSADYVTVK